MTKAGESKSTLTVNGITVHIVRKDIKNLHLAVYPPSGHIRVAVPNSTTDDNIRLAVISKLSWIKKQQQYFQEQPRQSKRQFISGECHYFFGQKYRLELIERYGKHEIKRLKSGKLKMLVNPGCSIHNKEKLLSAWYRAELNQKIIELLDKWQPIVDRSVSGWGIRKMRTKWGSCNIEQRRILMNLELAKKPLQCLEYILVHELIHLHERNHNERFKSLMGRFLPDWQSRRKLLNTSPLAHEDWEY
ncbi:SprT family zinc-dependent metalloprotease [Kangiella marina]|uniref:SprT family zinc-dependent metalloprotease n=1 Tax=Kangiella marina TaxID=1079178 RepID=A0ABP8IE14_9GAMM